MAVWGEKVYIPAIMGASGITKEQAKTCLYYAIATYFLPDDLKLIPILAIIGPQGTGKTDLLNQLRKIVNDPKLIGARTYPALRDKFGKTTTALLDDADDITEANEKILINRYSKANSVIQHMVNMGESHWVTKKTDVFGATLITKRLSFKDAAVTSRSIIIKTKYIPGDYKITRYRDAHKTLREKAEEIDLEEMGEPTSHRTKDNWMPLRAIATYFKDKEWLEYSDNEIKGGTRTLKAGQRYEPERALLMVLKEKMKEVTLNTGVMFKDNVFLREIKDGLRANFDINIKVIQIEELLRGLGFKTVRPSGYPKVKHNKKLLNKLLKKYE